MVVLEDFTRVSVGRYIPAEGHVVVCPRCGRSGLEQHSGEGTLFVHAQASEIFGDGMRIEPRDLCRISRL